jgi:hypothetical protein
VCIDEEQSLYQSSQHQIYKIDRLISKIEALALQSTRCDDATAGYCRTQQLAIKFKLLVRYKQCQNSSNVK